MVYVVCFKGMCIEPMACKLSCDISISNCLRASVFAELAKKLVDAGIAALKIVNKAIIKISSRHF